ncbi:membrane-spanning 4-domains subfamily A member 8-like [Molossus molossus]|uniref:membrane-spanning 4-domains subfamily A member 8-like n=1 Tax=Molossus molossus TaxID=27622 RepID=UPI00174688B5|nr:membrane-spanning 4-domains subfamily A member 8-like [Molossus molossus]XP_036115840.1 membrane-spanning 4-domains subfamily A member 8-like [Molossus molossus]
MDPMTSTGSVATSVFVTAPHGAPGSMSQVPLYRVQQSQLYVVPGNPQGLPPLGMQPAQRTLKEGKVFGAIQILIGLIHISLGSILGTLIMDYAAVSFIGGYPFWGGIMFIITGSLTVTSESLPNSSCLLNGSLGLNIVSAIFSVIGIALLITDMCVNPRRFYQGPFSSMAPGIGTSAVLFIFSLLEFSIACTCAHFGCLLVHHSQNNGTLVYQTVNMPNTEANPVPENSPPTHSSDVQDSK